MAYLEMGFSHDELRRRYEEESLEIPITELYARFGQPQFSDPLKPPYRFMLDETTDPQGMPGYNELKRPAFIDVKGRQYTLASQNDRAQVYVRLPKGVTTREERDQVSVWDRQDFPRRGEMIEFDSPSGERIKLTVRHVILQRMATALVELEEPVPQLEERNEESEQKRLEKQISRYKRKFKIEENQTELSEESAQILSRMHRPRQEHRRKDPYRIPRLPTAQKLKKLR